MSPLVTTFIPVQNYPMKRISPNLSSQHHLNYKPQIKFQPLLREQNCSLQSHQIQRSILNYFIIAFGKFLKLLPHKDCGLKVLHHIYTKIKIIFHHISSTEIYI